MLTSDVKADRDGPAPDGDRSGGRGPGCGVAGAAACCGDVGSTWGMEQGSSNRHTTSGAGGRHGMNAMQPAICHSVSLLAVRSGGGGSSSSSAARRRLSRSNLPWWV